VATAAGRTNARLAAWHQRAHGQGDEGGSQLVSASGTVEVGLAGILGGAQSRARWIGEGEGWRAGPMRPTRGLQPCAGNGCNGLAGRSSGSGPIGKRIWIRIFILNFFNGT
jgi:hypothetical protein